jgi:hypothetical protein
MWLPQLPPGPPPQHHAEAGSLIIASVNTPKPNNNAAISNAAPINFLFAMVIFKKRMENFY